MRIDRLLKKLGFDPPQFRWLLRWSIRRDFRSVKGRGAGAAGGLGVLLATYGFFSLFAAFAAALAADVYAAAFVALTYAQLMVTLVVLIEFGTIVVNPDDYLILGHLPVDRRTFLGAKLGNLGFFVLLTGLVTTLLPSIVLAVKFAPAAFPWFLLAGLSACFFAVLIVVWLYSLAIRFLPLEKVLDYLVYLQALFNFGLVIGNQWVMRLVQGVDVDRLTGLWYTALLPQSWFASLDFLAVGGFSGRHLLQGAVPLLLTVLIGRTILGRFSMDYAEFLQSQRESSRMVERRPLLERLFRGQSQEPQQQSVYGLILRYMARDRQLRLTLFPLFGMVIANCLVFFFLLPAQGDNSFFAGLMPVFMVGWTVQIALSSAYSTLTFSEDWQAAWIYWAVPLSGRALVRALRRALITAVFVPVTIFCLTLAAVKFPLDQAVMRFLPLCLFGLAAASLVNAMTGHPPLSREKKAGGGAAMYVVLTIAATVACVIPALLVLRTSLRTGSYPALMAGLCLLTALAWRIEERVLGRKILRTEYEG